MEHSIFIGDIIASQIAHYASKKYNYWFDRFILPPSYYNKNLIDLLKLRSSPRSTIYNPNSYDFQFLYKKIFYSFGFFLLYNITVDDKLTYLYDLLEHHLKVLNSIRLSNSSLCFIVPFFISSPSFTFSLDSIYNLYYTLYNNYPYFEFVFLNNIISEHNIHLIYGIDNFGLQNITDFIL